MLNTKSFVKNSFIQAITSGVIGGRALVFLPLAWGGSLISLGVSIFLRLGDMGDDPKCLVGWDNTVKWIFFGPVLSGAALSSIFSSISICNLAGPAIRKIHVIEEVSIYSA